MWRTHECSCIGAKARLKGSSAIRQSLGKWWSPKIAHLLLHQCEGACLGLGGGAGKKTRIVLLLLVTMWSELITAEERQMKAAVITLWKRSQRCRAWGGAWQRRFDNVGVIFFLTHDGQGLSCLYFIPFHWDGRLVCVWCLCWELFSQCCSLIVCT